MFTKLFVLLQTLFLLLIVPPVFSYYSTGYQIRDLEEDDECFVDDATSWGATTIWVSPIYTQCSGIYILGGYKVLGKSTSPFQKNDYFYRTYTGLSSTHTMVYFAFSFWAIDSWNSGDYFQIQIGDSVLTSWTTLDYGSYTVKNQLCGTSGAQYPDIADIRIFGRAAHSGTSLTFRLISKCDQDSTNEAIGFRDLTMLLADSPTITGATSAFCALTTNSVGSVACSCAEGKYLDSTNTCVTCNSACSSCFGSGSNQCYECASGYSFDGTQCFACASHCTACSGTGTDQCEECESGYLLYYNQCVLASECVSPLYEDDCKTTCKSPCDEDQYVYINSSCSDDCVFPLQKSTILDTLYCLYPCDSDEYLYWDGTCEDSCPEPLAVRSEPDEVYCDYGCASTGEYLYWDGTCSDSCPSPLAIETDHGRSFCTYPCDSDDYLYWDGTCQSSCPDPLTTRTEKAKNFCDYSCDTSQYLYWDSTCSDECESPLVIETSHDRSFCTYKCDSDEYLYWDETCSDECESPLIIETDHDRSFCTDPCDPDRYLYWDGTCSDECESPLVITIENDRSFCTYPCDSDKYLYWDGACKSGCFDPLTIRTENERNFCDYSCNSTSEYLYWDGSCSDSCSSPLVIVIEQSRLFCTYPCDSDQYLYQDATCEDSCGLQYTLRVEKDKNYCDKTCSNYQLWNGACVHTCDSPMRFLTNTSGAFCYPPCDDITEYYFPENKTCETTCNGTSKTVNHMYLACYENPAETSESSIKPVTLSKLLHHIRYLDIYYPEKLGNISILRGTNILSPRVISSMFTKVTNWPNRFTLAPVFEYYFLPSSFLANFGDDLILLAIIITAGMFCFILEKVLALIGFPHPKIFLSRLRIITQWNLPIMIIIQNTGDIFFFAIIEFRTLDLTQGVNSILSFILCLTMLLLVVAVYVFGVLFIKKSQFTKKESPKLHLKNIHFVDRWEKFQVLFRGYNDKCFLTQSFLLIYSARLLLPMLIASSLYTLPLMQTILFTIITTLTLIYLVTQKPIRRRFDLINIILVEFLILLSDICLLCLVILDGNQVTMRKSLAEAIVICNYCLDALAILALIIKSILVIRSAIDFRKQKKRKQEHSAWLQLLYLPLQQGSLGFEQVQVDSFSTNIVVPQIDTITLHDNSSNILSHSQSTLELRSSQASPALASSQVTNLSPTKLKIDQIPDSQRNLTPDSPHRKDEETFLRRKKLTERLNLKSKIPLNFLNASPEEAKPQNLIQLQPSVNVQRINSIRKFVTSYRHQRQKVLLDENHQDFPLNSAAWKPLNEVEDTTSIIEQIEHLGSPVLKSQEL